MNELKPCPFCGKKEVEAVEDFEHDGLHSGGWRWIVRCNYLKGGCGCTGGGRPTEEEAIRAWNKRA